MMSSTLQRVGHCHYQRRNYSLLQAFETVSRNRHAEKNFSSKEVPSAIVRKVIELTQLAPSSFNIQPYKIILINSVDMKEMVSTAMNPGNDRHVKTAAYTAIFTADKEPAGSARKLMDLEAKHGAHPAYVSSLPAKITLLLGGGAISKRIRALGSHLLSPLSPAPVINTSNEAWASKNASFAAQQFMLAATACGLRTHPMEGFDERRLSAILGFSMDHYTVPVVICMGYSASEADPLLSLSNQQEVLAYCADSTDRKQYPRKVRFPLEDICYGERFGQKMDFEDNRVEEPSVDDIII